MKIGIVIKGVDSARQLRAFRAGIIDRLSNMLTDTGVEVVGTSREKYLSGPKPEHLGRVSGDLARLTDYQVQGDKVTIGNNLPYGRIWEEGGTIPAHDIRPKNPGGVLAFFAGGKTVFARVVHQPARDVKPRPYLAPALADSLGKIKEIAQYWVDEALNGAMA